MDAIFLLLAGVILFFSDEAMHAACMAAQTFAAKVMPALFPMMVIGGLMNHRSEQKQLRTSDVLFQISFAFCAGCPASTRRLAGLRLPDAQYRIFLCFCGVMSPMFFTGTLASLLGRQNGWILLCCHWGSALLTGCVCAVINKYLPTRSATAKPAQAPPSRSKSADPLSLPAALTESIQQASLSLLAVLGTMMFFSILASVLQGIVCCLFPQWAAAHTPTLAIGWAVLEIGGGMVALLAKVPKLPLWAVCALCSFGGLSIWLQNLLFLSKQIHPAELLAWRALHGVIAGLLCYGATGSYASPAAAIYGLQTTVSGRAILLPLLLLIPVSLLRQGHRSS